MQTARWRFIGKADPERLAALAAPLPRTALAPALRDGLTLQCFHREPREHDPSYARAVFCGMVGHSLFDFFFNSNTGYRGAFFEDPQVGSAANRALLDNLSTFLVDWALTEEPHQDRSWIQASLSQPSAKAWLAEHPGLCPKCTGEWSTSYVSDLEVQNSRWEFSPHIHAAWGRQAPCFTKLRFFGGFIDERHKEWLAPHKSERAMGIWEHGWS